jgi:hypothetical protein
LSFGYIGQRGVEKPVFFALHRMSEALRAIE